MKTAARESQQLSNSLKVNALSLQEKGETSATVAEERTTMREIAISKTNCASTVVIRATFPECAELKGNTRRIMQSQSGGKMSNRKRKCIKWM